MKTFPNLIICEHCDSVYQRRILAPGDAARCTRCDVVLYEADRLDVTHRFALTVAAAIAFVIANVCPVIRIDLQGLHNESTLWQAVAALAHGAAAPVALPAALTLIAAPFGQIGLLAWILAHARAGRRAPGFAWAMRMLAAIRPWSMVEVGLLAILVAVVKLAGFVGVAPGAGLWAMAGLTACLVLVAGRCQRDLWDSVGGGTPGWKWRS
jgi:paraquat-inducible protein A